MPPPTPSQQRADIALAAVVLVGTLISAALSAVTGLYRDEQAPTFYTVVYALALAVPLAFRRRSPSVVAVIVTVAYFTAVTLRVPEVFVGNIAVFIAFYTVGAWSTDRRRALIVRALITVGMFVWLLVVMFQSATSGDDGLSRAGAFSPYVASMLLNILINALYFGGAYYFGERAYASMRQRAVLEQRTVELELERETTAAQAVALDRVRIARELHDVVAHHVSLMGVQAGAARAVLTKDPDAARGALAHVEESARTALGELRQLLETLRAPGAEPEGTAPTTLGLAALPGLVDDAVAGGLPTRLSVVGAPVEVPPLVHVNLFRIAQEALTNARRHAGPGAEADVRLRYTPDAVEVEVVNTGRRVAVGRPGLGRLGMRERAAVSGGHLESGPRADGGWLVRATVPLGARVVGAGGAAAAGEVRDA